jgi:uncharacterized RDD family membrane protein YckC
MPSTSSFTAEPGKRLWAGGFDFLAICIVFVAIGAVGEQFGFDLARWVVFGMVYFAYHFGCLIARVGRTLGKTAVDICVVSTTGQPLSVDQCLLRAGVRAVPFVLLSVPGVDIISAVLLLVLVLSEFYLMKQPPARQTIADHVAHSLVVKLPPLQPHRAPAGPMFSASDAEFGFPPQRPPRDDKDRQPRSDLVFERFARSRAFVHAIDTPGDTRRVYAI